MGKKLSIIGLLLVAVGLIYYFGFYEKEGSLLQEPLEQSSDLKIEILTPGSGEPAANGDTVVVHYTGTFLDGTKFDSSLDRGQPFSFTLGLGQVIQGWEQGVLGMKVGEKRKLVIAPVLAYGSSGIPGAIPPDSTLVFEVELLEIR